MPHFDAPLTPPPLEDLTAVEEQVVRAVCAGERAVLGDGERPQQPDTDRLIRIEVLRHLLLGGDAITPVPAFGVQIMGAYFTGELNLAGCDVPFGARLLNCYFDARINAPALRINRLNLRGSSVEGLYLERARIDGYLLCKDGFVSRGKVTLTGAQIDGNLSFAGGVIDCPGDFAIAASRCKVTDTVALSEGFRATGRITLVGARIGGQLTISNADIQSDSAFTINAQRVQVGESLFVHNDTTVTGGIKLTGAQIDGQLIVRDLSMQAVPDQPLSLSMGSVRVKDALILRRVTTKGEIKLTSGQAGSFNDDRGSWGMCSGYELDDFTYDSLRTSSFDVDALLAWLNGAHSSRSFEDDNGHEEAQELPDFNPQPYQQLAKVLGDMGHRRDRGKVLMVMEEKLRAWQLSEMRRTKANALQGRWFATVRGLWPDTRITLHWLFGFLSRWIVGYGHRPAYSIVWAVLIIGAMTAFSQQTYAAGDFAPTAAPILISDAWVSLAQPVSDGGVDHPADIWSGPTGAGRDYSTFNAFYYAADLFIPLVNFGQDADWAPSTTRSPWGIVAHWVEPFVRGLGWLITAMGAAAITGTIRNE